MRAYTVIFTVNEGMFHDNRVVHNIICLTLMIKPLFHKNIVIFREIAQKAAQLLNFEHMNYYYMYHICTEILHRQSYLLVYVCTVPSQHSIL